MGRKRLNHLNNIGVEIGNSEVISVEAGEKIVGFGECGDKEVELGRGYICDHRDYHPGMKRGGEGKVVSATGCSLF